MIIIDQNKYESIISEIINTKDIHSLVDKYLKDKIYYYSILHDICDPDSANRSIVKNTAHNLKLGQSYVREQANTINSYLSPDPPKEDYYEILNVSPDSTKEEIRKSWTKLMKDHHPDLIGEKGLDTSRKINEAYSILKDEKKRKIFDEKRMPFLKVKVKKYKKKYNTNLKKFAIVAATLVLFILSISMIFNKKERTELADFRSSKLSTENNSDIIISAPQVDEDSRILEQIEKIDPINKNKADPEKKNNKEVDKNEFQKNNEASDIETANNSVSEVDDIDKILKEIKESELIVDKKKETLRSDNPAKNKMGNSKISSSEYQEKRTEVANQKSFIQNNDTEFENAQKSVPTSSSLYRFVSEYVSAYKNMDVDKITNLFHTDAMENGVPVSEAIKLYATNFNKNDILKYDLKINNTRIQNSSGYVDSNFNIVFQKLSDNEIKTTNGKITWNLIWDNESWKIKEINYNIYNTKSINESTKK